MGSKQCCCGPSAPGTCCDSGCECWADVYEATVPEFVMGQSERCDCCAACAGTIEEFNCCHELGPNGLSDPNCDVFADPEDHKCCERANWKIIDGQITIYRTGNLFPCTNTLFPRTCTDPWSPPTRSVQDTAPGCNVYETDYGIIAASGTTVYPCPDNPQPDYIEFEFFRQIYGGSCTNCPWGFFDGGTPQMVNVQENVPVRATMTCCGDAGTSKSGCAPCDGDTLPGSGVPHYLVITPLAGIQYSWNQFGQTFQLAIEPPTLVFARRLSCSSTPQGTWRFLGTGFGFCQTSSGFSGICPCEPRTDGCESKCSATGGGLSLCNCNWDYSGTICEPPDFECPGCAGQEDPTFGDITLGAVE